MKSKTLNLKWVSCRMSPVVCVLFCGIGFLNLEGVVIVGIMGSCGLLSKWG